MPSRNGRKKKGGGRKAPALPSTRLSVFAYGSVIPETMIAVVKAARKWKDLDVDIRFNDALICRSRDKAAADLARSEFDVMIMLDHDVVWEDGDLEHLAKRCAETKGIVAGIYPKRGHNQGPPVRFHKDMVGRVTFGEDQLVPATYVATGFFAIHREAVMKIGEKMPFTMNGFWPMLTPTIASHGTGAFEYLSEDYAICARAIEAGIPVHATMKPRLKHVGHYIYRMVDAEILPPDDKPVSIALTGDRATGLPMLDKMLVDVMDFTTIPIDAFNQTVRDARMSMTELWEKADVRDAATEREYYKTDSVGRRYIFDLADWHLRGVITGIAREIEETIPVIEGPVLDYGAGIGTLALHLAQMGADVDVYELNDVLREFISFRAERHEIKINQKTPETLRDQYAVIICWHVLEHLPEAEQAEVAQLLERHLAPGGRIISQSDFHVDEIHPFHHEREDNGDGLLADVGLVRVGPNTWARASEVEVDKTLEAVSA